MDDPKREPHEDIFEWMDDDPERAPNRPRKRPVPVVSDHFRKPTKLIAAN